MKLKKNLGLLKPYIAGKPSSEKKIIKLNANECPFDLPSKIYRKAAKISAINRYHEPSGLQLREKLSKVFDIDANQLILGNGSGELIQIYLQAFSEKGSKIILSDGTFTLYEMYGRINENEIIKVPLKPDFSMDIDTMISKIDANTSALFICNPNNPTGLSYSYDELEKFISKIPSAVGIFLDEAYIFYSKYFDDSKVKALISKYNNLFILRTFSKIGLAGARIGYGISHLDTIAAMNRVRPPFNINSYAMNLAEWILDSKKFLAKIKENNHIQKNFIINSLKELFVEIVDSDTNFILVKLTHGAELELEHKNILIRNTKSFGLPSDYYRITIGKKSENVTLIETLKEVILCIVG